MRRLHIALAVQDLDASVAEYTQRLGAEPCAIVSGIYALWRTPQTNFSISVRPEQAGQLRHLGWEDSAATSLEEETDCNGIAWERFTGAQQRAEIDALWDNAEHFPERAQPPEDA